MTIMEAGTVEMITSGGYWLDEESNRGWYTCQLTGKKFRGVEAEAILEEMTAIRQQQEDQEEEYHSEVEEAAPATLTGGELTTAEMQEEDEEAQRMTERLQVHIASRQLVDGSGDGVKLVAIECVDCKGERIIKVQDAFQVKRCVGCQKEHTNRRRRERRRAKKAEAVES